MRVLLVASFGAFLAFLDATIVNVAFPSIRESLVAPLPVVEQLSRETSAVMVPDGVAVVREGEPGDRFFVVSSGAVAVSREGREVRRLGPGASFGEIALLRDMTRTATVTAVGPTVLVALDRTHFLRALGMVPTGLGLAEGIAQDYLDADAAAQRADDS